MLSLRARHLLRGEQLVVVLGQALRTTAMWQAGSNFTHMVSTRKARGHVLVTEGVYRYSRHPSYCGWYWWCVGTQVLLCNPVCAAGYAWVSWRFFDGRVRREEAMLLQFFGNDYAEYRERTPVGIPFIR